MLKIKHILTTKINIRNLETSSNRQQIFKEILLNALVIQLLLEILNQRSILIGLASPLNNPLMFLTNLALLSSLLSLSLFLPKRHLGYLIVNTLWVWIGVINFILLGSRTTPLTAMDFKMLTSVFTVISRYLNLFQLSLFFLAVLLVFILIIRIGMKLPRTKWSPLQAMVATLLSLVMMLGSFSTAQALGAVSTNFGNIADAYLDYGLAYSFATSIIDKGINKPEHYSTAEVNLVLNSMNEEEQESLSSTNKYQNISPNIIFVQLESFFDVKRMKALSFSEDPLPNLTALREEYSSGYLTVPSIGAGTVNTEFEILTGMNLDYFGAGEYPYKTILSESTVESYVYDLAELGYQSQAIHNNMGTFYSRHSVYPKLGFDGFTSIEYMNNIEYNEMGWADDSVLVPEIVNTLKSTAEKDFIFAVTVQSHGKYPEYSVIENPKIELYATSSIPNMNTNDSIDTQVDAEASEPIPSNPSSLEEVNYYKYLYYVNQIHEEDAFVGELIKSLKTVREPLVVVFYGDHLPTLDIIEEDLYVGSPFQTEYVIWDNIGLESVQKDLHAYQLGAMVMERLGYTNGLINQYHQEMQESQTYETGLELLQYDMLYGNKDAYGGINPYLKTDMVMGIKPISITSIDAQGEAIFIKGTYFTPWSEVYIDDKQKETIYLDDQTLIVTDLKRSDGMNITVRQVTETGKQLSSTLPYIVGDEHPIIEAS